MMLKKSWFRNWLISKSKLIEFVILFFGGLFLLYLVAPFGILYLPKTEPKVIIENIEQCLINCDFGIEVPKIGVQAPVIPDTPGADKEIYLKTMENGVAHFAGTKKPGEGGLIFIFGHSSYYSWSPGEYKDVFANLEDLEIGDNIIAWYQNKKYTYQVFESKVISPKDVSSLLPTDKERLTLMTCVPVGTAAKRLIVNAELIK